MTLTLPQRNCSQLKHLSLQLCQRKVSYTKEIYLECRECIRYLSDEQRLNPSSYCCCGKCSVMETIAESFCCLPKYKSKVEGLKNFLFYFIWKPSLFKYWFLGKCITDLKMFNRLLDPTVLEVNLRWKYNSNLHRGFIYVSRSVWCSGVDDTEDKDISNKLGFLSFYLTFDKCILSVTWDILDTEALMCG